ncbi:hypothetical protein EMPS_02558 [Entomortierella parvispora]|uniref:Glycosyl transferase family 1 domain-containing protein n=1 Tax=Entomortierella parvispora TaxID=205924 RepID=A0A9P3LTS8_9FUNG|nr:hypothetical protein EMPS_02558 [Entomortierella parvispora]
MGSAIYMVESASNPARKHSTFHLKTYHNSGRNAQRHNSKSLSTLFCYTTARPAPASKRPRPRCAEVPFCFCTSAPSSADPFLVNKLKQPTSLTHRFQLGTMHVMFFLALQVLSLAILTVSGQPDLYKEMHEQDPVLKLVVPSPASQVIHPGTLRDQAMEEVCKLPSCTPDTNASTQAHTFATVGIDTGSMMWENVTGQVLGCCLPPNSSSAPPSSEICGMSCTRFDSQLPQQPRQEIPALRIAVIAPPHEAVPPKLYGGTERVVSYLTEALVELGHEVTLFASGDSQTKATLRATWPHALRLDPSVRDALAPVLLILEEVYQVADQFDVLHFHLDYLPFSLFSRSPVPFLNTFHGRLDLPELQPVFNKFPHAPVTSISDSQRSPIPQANWMRTVYHGLPVDLLTPRLDIQPEYLAFLGRICPEKGVDRAIRIAAQSGLPLKIAAKVDKADVEYFETMIKPLLGQAHVEFIGEINEAQKPAFLSGAKALLFPINWPEPFGLVMIEAMACGTPVIAFNRGSVPEIIEHGVTGFIVEDEQGAIGAVDRIEGLSRSEIRTQFEQRFSAHTMANHYLDLYQTVIQQKQHSNSRHVVG